MKQKELDVLGYQKLIDNVHKRIQNSSKITLENKQVLFQFEEIIRHEPSKKGSVRSLGHQQKMCADAYYIALQLGEIPFQRLIESQEKFETFIKKVQRIPSWGESSKSQRLMSLRQLIQLCFKAPSWVKELRTGRIKYRKPKEAELFTPTEMLRIIEASGTVRYRALFSICREGLRPNEFMRLNYESVTFDEEGRALIQAIGKTGQRLVPTRRGAIYLRKWLDEHPFKKQGSPLFPTGKGGRMKYEFINLLNRKVLAKAEISPLRSRKLYNWRKSSITSFLRQGGREREASIIFGTSRQEISATYDLVSERDVIQSVDLQAGIQASEIKPVLDTAKVCARCSAENESFQKICIACGWSLEQKNPIMTMEKQIEIMNEKMRIMQELILRKIDPVIAEKSPIEELKKVVVKK